MYKIYTIEINFTESFVLGDRPNTEDHNQNDSDNECNYKQSSGKSAASLFSFNTPVSSKNPNQGPDHDGINREHIAKNAIQHSVLQDEVDNQSNQQQ